MVRVVGPALVLVAVMLTTSASSAVAGESEPVDDEELVDALIDAAAALNWPLEGECVAAVVATGDVENLDDPLARMQLLDMLAAVPDDASEDTAGPADFIIDAGGGVLQINAPTVFDGDALRRQLLLCVAGSADPELVHQAAVAIAETDETGFFDHPCVARVLSVLSDETLQLMLDSETTSTVPADFVLTESIQSDIARLFVCMNDQTAATTSP